jgi:transketolase
MKESILKNRQAPANVSKTVFGDTLLRLGAEDDRIVVCEADLMRASGTRVFMDAYPDRHFNFGIAEQNMVSASAGMALCGKTVFASTFANFAAERACDQMSISVAYNKANVKLCGIYAGLTSEKNGGTHIAVEDVAIMRAMPNVTVIEPGDSEELRQAVRAAAAIEGPVYLRIPKTYKIDIFSSDYRFEIGKAAVIREGSDLSFCTCGIISGVALLAADELAKQGIEAKVVNFSTIKPLDADAVLDAAKTGYILTAENHSVIGGLGSAVTEVLCEHRIGVNIKRLGLADVFGKTASLDWQLAENGLSAAGLTDEALALISAGGASEEIRGGKK